MTSLETTFIDSSETQAGRQILETMSIAPPLALLPDPNDHEGWKTLIAHHEPKLKATISQFRFDDAEVEDVLQCTWIHLLERHQTIRKPEALAMWLRSVCRNECVNRTRHNGRHIQVDRQEVYEAQQEPTDLPEQITLTRLQRTALVRALQAIKPDRALVVVGSVVEKRSYKELARLLNVPTGSIGPCRIRGLSQLSKHSQLRNLVI